MIDRANPKHQKLATIKKLYSKQELSDINKKFMKQLKWKSYFCLCVFSCLLLAFIAYLNGKLDENTKYAVFQRSFDQYGNYENEGFLKFTTKKVIKDKFPTALMALSIVVGLLAALILVGGIKMWRRNHNGAFYFNILVFSNFPI